jgi:hypothetical protein
MRRRPESPDEQSAHMKDGLFIRDAAHEASTRDTRAIDMIESDKVIEVEVLRYRPEQDTKPFVQTFKVPYADDWRSGRVSADAAAARSLYAI